MNSVLIIIKKSSLAILYMYQQGAYVLTLLLNCAAEIVWLQLFCGTLIYDLWKNRTCTQICNSLYELWQVKQALNNSVFGFYCVYNRIK